MISRMAPRVPRTSFVSGAAGNCKCMPLDKNAIATQGTPLSMTFHETIADERGCPCADDYRSKGGGRVGAAINARLWY